MTKSITALMLIALVPLAACNSDKSDGSRPSSGSDSAAMADVTASDCAVINKSGTALVTGTVKITNSTDRAQLYTVTISVNDSTGTRLGEINTFADSLGAGQSTTLSGTKMTGFAPQGAKPGPATCAIANVTRLPSSSLSK